MADYYPLIARAVTGLDKSTGEARRALYERARTALVAQLRGVEPALTEADITRERLALEEAIRKVEAEAARRPRQPSAEWPRANPKVQQPPGDKPASAAPPPPPPPPAPPPPPPPEVRSAETRPADWDELRRELDNLASTPQPEGRAAPDREPMAPAEPPPAPSREEPQRSFEPPSRPDHVAPRETAPRSGAALPEPPPPARNTRFSGAHAPMVNEGAKGFRDGIGQAGEREEGIASSTSLARAALDADPPPSNKSERIERRPRPDNFTPSEQQRPPPPVRLEQHGRPDARGVPPYPDPRGARGTPPVPPGREPRPIPSARPIPPPPDSGEFEEPEEQPLRRGWGGARMIIALAVVVVLAAAAIFAYLEWGGGMTPTVQLGRSPATQAPKQAPQERPKISDRIGGTQQQDSAARPARNAGAAVAQRAVLYEQQTDPQERKQYVGSVIWRTETSSPGPGQPADVAVKAEVEIPERNMRMNFTIRRNLEESLPASHTIEILFSTPADFQPGGIADVPNVLMEDTEQKSGAPLTGLRVKVTNGFFLVGLSSVESDVKRNAQLLKERPWVHLRMVYNNGQRALLAIEKGVPGDRVFEEALNAWGQNPPLQR